MNSVAVMKMRLMIAVSIVAVALWAAPAGANLIAYEGFDYTVAIDKLQNEAKVL